MKVADVKLTWKKSPSSDVEKVNITTVINGAATTVELGPEIESFMIEVRALGSVSFSIETIDKEGMTATSEDYAFALGDLEAPQPATDLFHEITGIRDVSDEEPVPDPELPSRRR